MKDCKVLWNFKDKIMGTLDTIGKARGLVVIQDWIQILILLLTIGMTLD